MAIGTRRPRSGLTGTVGILVHLTVLRAGLAVGPPFKTPSGTTHGCRRWNAASPPYCRVAAVELNPGSYVGKLLVSAL